MECWQRPTRSDCVHAGVTFVRRLPKQLLELSEEPRKLSGFSHTHFSSQARRHPERQDVQGERREARLPERAAPRRHTQGRHHRARVSIASAHGGALAGRSFDHLVHRTLLPLLTEVIDGRLGAERALEARKVAQRIEKSGAVDRSSRMGKKFVLLYYRHYRTERADDTRIHVGPHGVISVEVCGGRWTGRGVDAVVGRLLDVSRARGTRRRRVVATVFDFESFRRCLLSAGGL